LRQIHRIFENANTVVDVASLSRPSGRFMATLRNGITYLAKTKRPVTVRVLLGQSAVDPTLEPRAILSDLVRDAREVAGSKLTVVVGKTSYSEGRTRGVYQFTDHEEADAWMIKTIANTHGTS
jgi:hypothetical protein